MWFFIKELVFFGIEKFFLNISRQFAQVFSDKKRLSVVKTLPSANIGNEAIGQQLLKKLNVFGNVVLDVKADKANYYKKSKNIKYYQNVEILNKDGIIKADIANFLADKNLIRLEKNVVYKDKKNIVKGDIAELNTITNNLEIFMLKKKDRVYGKRN